MIWRDEVLAEIQNYMAETPTTYGQVAQELTERFGEIIHSEQLRGALRRYNARAKIALSRQEYLDSLPAKNVGDNEGPALIPVEPPRPRVISPIIPTEHKPRAHKPLRFRIGGIGDTHLCSNYEDLDALNRMYDIFQQEGVTNVYHTGNFIDGEARFNANDLKVRGMDNQIRYFVDNYPRRDGITTHYIAGDDHEGWYVQNIGIEIGEHLEDVARRLGRTDLNYLGYMEADVPVTLPDGDSLILRVLHAGGGSSYALSHTSQKIVDSYEQEERPFLLLVGHYHKAEHLPNYRNVHIIQTGTFQHQTPFMRKKRLHADIGGWIIDISIIDERTTRVSAEFIHFAAKPWRHVMS